MTLAALSDLHKMVNLKKQSRQTLYNGYAYRCLNPTNPNSFYTDIIVQSFALVLCNAPEKCKREKQKEMSVSFKK